MDLRNIFRRMSERLLAEFRLSAEINHAVGKGTFREDAFKSFLIQYLPNRYAVGSGEVISSQNAISGQLDVIIYDPFQCPRLIVKSVARDKIEAQFRTLLKNLAPKPEVLKLTKLLLEESYADRVKNHEKHLSTIRAQIADKETLKSKYMLKLANSDDSELEEMLKTELKANRQKIDQLSAKLQKAGSIDRSFGIVLNTVTEFMANPYQLWEQGNFEQKRGTLRLVFADKIAYSREKGFGITPKTLPFRLLEQNEDQKMVWCTRRDLNPQPLPSEGNTLSN